MENSKGTVVYKASKWSWQYGVTKLLAERVTEKSIWVNGRRISRQSEKESIFDDFASAKAHLVQAAETQVEIARERLRHCSQLLEMASAVEESTITFKQ